MALFHRIVDVNLTGTFLCCREVVAVMRGAGYGRVVNIASVAGKDGNPNASAYSASKAGVIGLTAWFMVSNAGLGGIRIISNLGGFPALLLYVLVLLGLIRLIVGSFNSENKARKVDKTVD